MNDHLKTLHLRNVLTLSVLGVLIWFLLPFLKPLVMAALFAFALDPVLVPIFNRYRLSRQRMSASILVGLMLIILIPIGILFGRLASRLSSSESRESLKQSMVSIFGQVKEMLASAFALLSQNFDPDWIADFEAQLQNLESALIGKMGMLLESVGVGLTQLPMILGSFLVFFAALYVFVAEAPRLRLSLEEILPSEATRLGEVIDLFQDSCRSALLSTLIVGLIQASVLALATVLLGYGDPWLAFPLAFLTSFIPLVGVGPLAFLLGLGAWAVGQQGVAIAYIILSVIIGTLDNVIRAYLLGSGEARIHPVFGLLIIIGAVMTIGLTGLFIGPVVANLGAHALQRLRSSPESSAVGKGVDDSLS